MYERCVERAQDEYSIIVRGLRKLLGAAGKKTYQERVLNEPTRRMLGNAFMLAETALMAATQEPFGQTELNRLRAGLLSLLLTQEQAGVWDREHSIEFVGSVLERLQMEPEATEQQGMTVEEMIHELFGEGARVSSPFPGITFVETMLADFFRPRAPSANEGNSSKDGTMQQQEQPMYDPHPERPTSWPGGGNEPRPLSDQPSGVPVERVPSHPFPTTDEPAGGGEPIPASEVRPESGGDSER